MMSMTYEEIYAMIAGIGYPAAYYQFPETSTAPPFICFYFPSSDDIIADGENYLKKEVLYIELYTMGKSFEAEKQVEAALRANGFVYTRTETYLDTEKMFMELYTMEVYING